MKSLQHSDGEDDDDEAGLSDEGLGDITSEASNSPQPPQINSSSGLNKNNYVKSSEDCDNNPVVQHVVAQPRNVNINKSEQQVFSVKSEVFKNSSITSSSLPTSPCDERVPSRIAFPKPRKSQTHL